MRTKLELIRERGVLKVGTTGDYMPMSFLDPEMGCYFGIDAELAEDLADSLGVKLEYVETTWPSLLEDTIAGRFDLAICGITITDDRKEKALMSDSYLANGKTNIQALKRSTGPRCALFRIRAVRMKNSRVRTCRMRS